MGSTSSASSSSLPSSQRRPLFASDELLELPSTAAATIRPRVCVLDQGHYSELALKLATRLGLALVVDSNASTTENNNAFDASSLSGPFSHALTLIPHHDDNDDDDDDYAVGVAPMVAPTASTTTAATNGQRRRRRARTRTRTSTRTLITTKPLVVEFQAASLRGRRPGKDLLVQAVFASSSSSSSKQTPPFVVDLTAGLGADALVLVQAGAAHVTMVERNPIVATLLQDGLRRLQRYEQQQLQQNHQMERALLSSRMSLIVGDGVAVASQLLCAVEDGSTSTSSSRQGSGRPNVVYLDPMFPPRTKSAAVKKNMQILHSLLSSQQEDSKEIDVEQEQLLLKAALNLVRCAHDDGGRVVVKRPLQAPCLAKAVPSYSVKGSTHRWDVYLVAQQE